MINDFFSTLVRFMGPPKITPPKMTASIETSIQHPLIGEDPVRALFKIRGLEDIDKDGNPEVVIEVAIPGWKSGERRVELGSDVLETISGLFVGSVEAAANMLALTMAAPKA